MYRKNFLGLEGFVWFIGVVENRQDPLYLGRCQVRIFGWHTDDLTQIPSADLPWAQPMMATNASNTTNAPKEGDMVIGFFTDGESGQMPVYLGVLPGIPANAATHKGFNDLRQKDQLDNAPVKPLSRVLNSTNGVLMKTESKTPYPRNVDVPTTSPLAINESTTNTVIDFRLQNWVQVDSVGGTTWKEPITGYNTLYPFSSTMESESGNVFQIDDTPGNERIMLAHRTGTTSEYYNSGTKLEKIVKDNYTIVHGSDFAYVKGKLELTCDNVAHIRVKGKTTIEIDGDVDWKIGGQMNLSVGKGLNIKTGGNINYDVAGDIQQVTGGSYHAQSGGSFDALAAGNIGFDGATVNMNSGTAPGTSPTGIAAPNAYNNPADIVPLPEKIQPVKYPKPAIPSSVLPPTTAKPETIVINETPPVTNTADYIANTQSGVCFTLPMLQACAPQTPAATLNAFLPSLNKLCAKYGINTQLRKAHFLSQVAHESGGFVFTQENLNYSAQGLLATFPSYFTAATAAQYARNPTAIANHVYANRMGNGDESSGDGWSYHGRGLIQLTGHDNYARFANAIGLSLTDTIAYLQTTDGAVESAGWFWASRFINTAADDNNIQQVTKLVNGGLNGIQDRITRFNAVYPLCA